jgi:isopropylmalate/homocitrate/citramalate synthase
MTRAAVSQARNHAEEVEFSAEDATRSDIDYLCEVLDTAVELELQFEHSGYGRLYNADGTGKRLRRLMSAW